MSRSFTVEHRENPWGDEKWCFCFNKAVTGIGEKNQRWWGTKEQLVGELTRLGIGPDKYDLIPT